jgi:BirA family transcriptional regulator, biotin operon repressor / biotin---[acetyl-CoA-carboxylase] ligase
MFSQDYKLIHLESVSSTNLHASDLLSGKLVAGPTLIIADFQTEGKGQGNNKWESLASQNLLFSLIVFPVKIKAKEQFYISKIAAIAIRETISEHLTHVKIKWPNDILINKLKISGILIENTLKSDLINSSVIGIGVNINQSDFTVPATSFKKETGKEYDPMTQVNSFLNSFQYWFEILQSRDFAQIDIEYYKNLFGFQEWLRFSWGGVEFEAFIEGVEADGYLVLKARDGKILKFGFREVEFLID